ncbi:MAG TPA: CBS domain-containing protein, partial [Thermococcus sp.]|nr:CBS domain-containing protein [Thermococcus sp.]
MKLFNLLLGRSMILRLKVKDVMVTDLVTVAADVSVQAATRIMNDFEIGCLLVVSGRRLVGIVTERDIL